MKYLEYQILIIAKWLSLIFHLIFEYEIFPKDIHILQFKKVTKLIRILFCKEFKSNEEMSL